MEFYSTGNAYIPTRGNNKHTLLTTTTHTKEKWRAREQWVPVPTYPVLVFEAKILFPYLFRQSFYSLNAVLVSNQ